MGLLTCWGFDVLIHPTDGSQSINRQPAQFTHIAAGDTPIAAPLKLMTNPLNVGEIMMTAKPPDGRVSHRPTGGQYHRRLQQVPDYSCAIQNRWVLLTAGGMIV